MPTNGGRDTDQKIVIRKNGPYVVQGDVPLVCKSQVVSEYGDPITWKKEGTLEGGETYELCRCGHSREKPFCDGTHRKIGFDGTETADTTPTAERQVIYAGGALALATTLTLKDKGEPLPAALVLVSPCTDIQGTGESVKTKAKAEAILPANIFTVVKNIIRRARTWTVHMFPHCTGIIAVFHRCS